MNYLQMAQEVRKLIGIQGTGPSSVAATGAEGVILATVKQVWEDIQNYRSDWKWMREDKSFNLVAGKALYTITDIFTPQNRFKSWYKDSFYISVNGKKSPIRFLEYDFFEYAHINDSEQVIPSEFTIKPKDYSFWTSIPNSNYLIDCDYKKSNQTLTSATDTPECPADYHWLIVYEATARYALSIALGSIYDQYNQKASELLGSLLREHNPKKIFKIRGIA